MKKTPKAKDAKPSKPKFDHHCDWREAALKLAACVVETLRTDGKIGAGSGLVTKVVDGKRFVERWDKDFIEALAFIGVEVQEAPKAPKAPKRKPLHQIGAPRA